MFKISLRSRSSLLLRGANISSARPICFVLRRSFTVDGRSRASNIWAPTGGIAQKTGEEDDANALMIRAGLLRQAHGGLFHLLPLGLRIQEKLERLIDRHIQSIGASKVSLSSISSQSLWEQSGRIGGTELFKFEDRREGKWLLAPTHEEEITALVRDIASSYKELPLRLYQTTRKYRDEPRPRQGLLRSREFLMKDLYTFDYSYVQAQEAYKAAREAYNRIFDALKLPYLVAAADSGDMGGDLSHEYHLPSAKGEDTIISCTECDFVTNEELTGSRSAASEDSQTPGTYKPVASTWIGITRDKRSLVRAHFPQSIDAAEQDAGVRREINIHALKKIAQSFGYDLDISVVTPIQQMQALISEPQIDSNVQINLVDIFDHRLPSVDESSPALQDLIKDSASSDDSFRVINHTHHSTPEQPIDLVKVRDGDSCPSCSSGKVKTERAIELGHTFYLGTRYTKPLNANISVSTALIKNSPAVQSLVKKGERLPDKLDIPMEMGCYGIGISRIIAAVAGSLADAKGLNWPRVMAPFEAVVVPGAGLEADAERIYDLLQKSGDRETAAIDALLDDRDKRMGWKLNDADLIGYPVIVVVGKSWKEEKKVEVQCRRLGVREAVGEDQLVGFVQSLLEML